MEQGVIELDEGELDLQTTMEVGQTFVWHKVSGENLYTGEGDRYYTTKDGNVLILWQDGTDLHYRATGGMEQEVEKRLRLHESLLDVADAIQGIDHHLDRALDAFPGLRVLNDDFVPCLISYLCSVQMRIPRIKELYDALCREYGSTVAVDGREFLQFPSIEQLSRASEQDLRDLGIGYRAKYIANTVQQLQDGVIDPSRLKELPYREAHDEITKLYGVGDKVGDCVLLFSCDQMAAFPVDTWIRQALEEHYPELHSTDYHTIGENAREYFGEYIGYAQEYLFHYMRTADVV